MVEVYDGPPEKDGEAHAVLGGLGVAFLIALLVLALL